MKFLILFLFIFVSCSHFTQDGSKRLKSSEAPDFLKALVPQTGNIDDVEYYQKYKNKMTTYKVKYELNEFEVSVTVDKDGKFLEKEEDLDFKNLPEKLKNEINNYLSSRFKKYRITETERRTDKGQKVFIDVEIVSSDSKTPFLEISFDLEGNYISEEVEHVESIETLN